MPDFGNEKIKKDLHDRVKKALQSRETLTPERISQITEESLTQSFEAYIPEAQRAIKLEQVGYQKAYRDAYMDAQDFEQVTQKYFNTYSENELMSIVDFQAGKLSAGGKLNKQEYWDHVKQVITQKTIREIRQSVDKV